MHMIGVRVSINFNPRAPRGARQSTDDDSPEKRRFQSTRPARGATVETHSRIQARPISIHAPREGRDSFLPRLPWYMDRFQSTRPARGATCLPTSAISGSEISIHAPREGRDYSMGTVLLTSAISIHAPREGRDEALGRIAVANADFNPRAPRGARHQNTVRPVFKVAFQSTRPARGATRHYGTAQEHGTISIHAPREGRDPISAFISSSRFLFQSTRPARGATP